jgi:hypothetical protein
MITKIILQKYLKGWSSQNKVLEKNFPNFILMFFHENIDDCEYRAVFLSAYMVRKALFESLKNILYEIS